jgi:hypothetical protein
VSPKEEGPELLLALEPAQRTARLKEPLPPRKLGRRMVLMLWLLRIYVLIAVPLAVAAFLHALKG